MWRSARHYAPVGVALVVFLLVVTLAPTVEPTTSTLTSPAGATNPLDLLPAAFRPGASGVAVNGVHCGPGVRQIPWSKYAPWCQPRFRGSNDGATWQGVTGKTITISFRYAATAAEAALLSTVAPSTLGTEQGALKTAQAYITLFNREFELYGRRVVLKFFTGKGDILTEAEGGGQADAEADAATAQSLGAFADVSFIFNTPPYNEALAQHGVIAMGGDLESAQAYEQAAPYGFTPGPDCNKAALAAAEVIGRAMSGLPAIYAGNPALHTKKRVFGFIEPDNDEYKACTSFVQQTLESRFHTSFAVVFKYSFDLGTATGADQYTTAIDKLKAAGVTSVMCACDPVTPIYLTADADAQDYRPEWFTLSFGDAFSRLPRPDQWGHAISGGNGPVPQDKEEAYRAYRMVDPTGAIDPPYEAIYEPLLLLFDALQAAGPDLTPTTFEHGLWSLPPSQPGGEFGVWRFGPGTVDPASSFQILWYDPNAKSVTDGLKGAWLTCNHGALYTLTGTTSDLPSHHQLECGTG